MVLFFGNRPRLKQLGLRLKLTVSGGVCLDCGAASAFGLYDDDDGDDDDDDDDAIIVVVVAVFVANTYHSLGV